MTENDSLETKGSWKEYAGVIFIFALLVFGVVFGLWWLYNLGNTSGLANASFISDGSGIEKVCGRVVAFNNGTVKASPYENHVLVTTEQNGNIYISCK